MEVIRLHIEERSYQLLQRLAMLLASLNGQQVRQEHAKSLSELHQQVISSAGNQKPR